jgi:hypothetical protein
MKVQRKKIIITIAVILAIASIIDYGVMIIKINSQSLDFFIELRASYADRISDSEYEEKILPVLISNYKHNELVTLINRLVSLLVASILIVEFTKPKNHHYNDYNDYGGL